MNKKNTHYDLAEKLSESEFRFRVQYQNNPIPTFTWRRLGDTFILEDYNIAAGVLTRGDIVKYLKKTAREMYQNRPDILTDMNRCYDEKVVVRRTLPSESFHRPRILNVTWSFAPPDMIIAYLEDITERIHTEEALRESSKQFRAIADFTPDWENWVGPDGKLHWVNPSVFEFIGYTVEECMAMSNYPIAIIDESDQQRVRQLFLDALQGSSGNNIECQVVCKDGRKKWITVSWQPICDENGCRLGHRSSIRDITDRKRMDDQLFKTNERLEAMFSALPNLMFRIDQDGRIYDCHVSSIDRLYVPPAKFMGKKFADVLPEEPARIIMAALDEAAKRGSHHGATYCLPMPQGLSWYELSIAVMGEKKPFENQFIMLVRDITDRKQLEEDLKKAYDELEVRVLERTAELAAVIKKLNEHQDLLAAESRRLQEANTALKVLLQHREEDQRELERTILVNIRKLVLPYVEKLYSTSLTSVQAGYADVISDNLQNVVSPFLRNLTATYTDLTPREIDVANLVRDGKSAKEIGTLLNCSVRSIEFYKDNIRRKLGLTHQKTNLRTHLLSLNKTP